MTKEIFRKITGPRTPIYIKDVSAEEKKALMLFFDAQGLFNCDLL